MHPRTTERRAPDLLPATLLLLTVTTGLVDAVSFLGLGHIFTANMTGNVVFLAFGLAGAPGLSVSASDSCARLLLLGRAGRWAPFGLVGGKLSASVAGDRDRE